MNREREFLRLLERLTLAVERLAQIPPKRPKAKPPVRVASHAGSRRETHTNDGLTSGGIPPEEFFARREP